MMAQTWKSMVKSSMIDNFVKSNNNIVYRSVLLAPMLVYPLARYVEIIGIAFLAKTILCNHDYSVDNAKAYVERQRKNSDWTYTDVDSLLSRIDQQLLKKPQDDVCIDTRHIEEMLKTSEKDQTPRHAVKRCETIEECKSMYDPLQTLIQDSQSSTRSTAIGQSLPNLQNHNVIILPELASKAGKKEETMVSPDRFVESGVVQLIESMKKNGANVEQMSGEIRQNSKSAFEKLLASKIDVAVTHAGFLKSLAFEEIQKAALKGDEDAKSIVATFHLPEKRMYTIAEAKQRNIDLKSLSSDNIGGYRVWIDAYSNVLGLDKFTSLIELGDQFTDSTVVKIFGRREGHPMILVRHDIAENNAVNALRDNIKVDANILRVTEASRTLARGGLQMLLQKEDLQTIRIASSPFKRCLQTLLELIGERTTSPFPNTKDNVEFAKGKMKKKGIQTAELL